MNWHSRLSKSAVFPSVWAVPMLFAPAEMLAVSALQTDGVSRSVFIGVGVTLAIESLYLLFRYGAERAAGNAFPIVSYVVSAFVLRFNSPDLESAQTHVLLSVAILIPVRLVVRRELTSREGNARRAKFLIRQLLSRKEWPSTFANYRDCSMICSLRESIRDNAAPVLPLLAHEDVRVQVAALTALEFHPVWRIGQAEVVIHRATYTDQPAVRALALMTVTNVTEAGHVHALVPFLRDEFEEVRRAAAVAVLWDARSCWTDVCNDVRQALANPRAAKDGPLPCSGNLPPVALQDLVAWSAESGPVGKRATQTLLRHCQKAIHEDGSSEAIDRVTAMGASNQVSPAICVELAHRLHSADAFPVDVAARSLGAANPTMVRVLPAGALLSHHESPEGVVVLREAAQQLNREITLAVARLVQRYLCVDLGLPGGDELVPTNSREAAEITRRVQR
ncbi:MAG: hypothetical protein EXS09_18965 [Gemmataceae bacterium]|nr:hypothetical protein [Gemmataceae bacterium]